MKTTRNVTTDGCRVTREGSRGYSRITHLSRRRSIPQSGTDHASRIMHQASHFTFHVSRFTSAFTLLEVMIASGIFFMAVFSILALVSNCLRNANNLRRPEVDAGMAAALIIGQTNKLTEGELGGDFGDWYPGFSWDSESYEVDTNGLWQVDIMVNKRGHRDPVDKISIWVYSPDSKGSLSQPLGAPGRR